MEAAVRPNNQKASAQGTLSSQAQAFWLQWVEDAFPELDSRAYFLPPVYFNRVPMNKVPIAGGDALVLQKPPKSLGKPKGLEECLADLKTSSETNRPSNQDCLNLNQRVAAPSAAAESSSPQLSPVPDSDVRDDTAMQRVLFGLQKLSEKTKEVLVGINQLQFGEYLGEPCYAAAAAQLPRPANLSPALPRKWKRGDFDVLLIHRLYGLVVCEVKAFGDNVKELNMTEQDIDKNIRKKLEDAMTQLDKAEAMLSHLVSDIAPGLRITKTIAVPNLTSHQVQRALSDDLQMTQDLCRCLRTAGPADITGLCLCSDQMSDPKTPGDVSSEVLRELENWWQRLVAEARPDSHMTCHVYKTLVARFCGPATTVTVPCTSSPRLRIKTLGQAVSWTGQCYTALITLFPEQVHLLNISPPRIFVAGPPGTGKTLVVMLMGTEWLRFGHDVFIVSSVWRSRAACSMLYHLLLATINTRKTRETEEAAPGQLHLLQFDMTRDENVEKAVNELSQVARGGSLYVIADEVGGDFSAFCNKLLTRVPRLHLWAASCFHEYAPTGWQVEYLTRPLRSPPAVVREVRKDVTFTNHHVHQYKEPGVPDHTDGPPVTHLYHRGRGHSSLLPVDCLRCGREVASFLHSLRVGVPENDRDGRTPPHLHWRDVLVLYWANISDRSGIVTGLKEAGIPVRVMEDDDTVDVATGRSDVVWVAYGDRIQGLERKVVVCLDVYARLHGMSRCSSQLVIVSPDM